jgi:predicted dehydrogenase
MVDLARRALARDGDALATASAWTLPGPGPDSLDEHAVAVYRSRRGRTFCLQASRLEAHTVPVARFTLIGDAGHVEADLGNHTTRLARLTPVGAREQIEQHPRLDPDPSWAAELAALRDAIRLGTSLPGDGRDALESQRLVEAAYLSAASGGQPVPLDPNPARQSGKPREPVTNRERR